MKRFKETTITCRFDYDDSITLKQHNDKLARIVYGQDGDRDGDYVVMDLKRLEQLKAVVDEAVEAIKENTEDPDALTPNARGEYPALRCALMADDHLHIRRDSQGVWVNSVKNNRNAGVLLSYHDARTLIAQLTQALDNAS